nr:MAG TPA: hypothetical protein [Caudoviricetes sp.]
MDYIKILPRCEAYLLVNYDGDYFRLLTNLSDQLKWIRTFFHRAATCYSEGKTYRDAFGDEEWETAMETLSDVTIKVLGYAHTRNGITVYFEEDLPVYEDPELWNMYEPTPEGMDQFLCYLNQLIYSLERTPDLAMSITSPLMELVRSIGGDLEAEMEAELDREEFYQKIESI